MKYFVMINEKIIVPEVAETARAARRKTRDRLEEIPEGFLRVKAFRPGSPEAEEATQHCEVISQAELSLVYDSFLSAKNLTALAEEKERQAAAKLRQARLEMMSAKDQLKDHYQWLDKKAQELGLPAEYRRFYEILDDDDEED